MKKIILPILTSALLMGCGSTKPQVEIVPQTTHDTIYLSNHRYDSIYIHTDRTTEYHPANIILSRIALLAKNHQPSIINQVDTLFIKDKVIEYKYRLKHDTIRIHKTDSIPVIHQVEVTREVPYIPWLVRTLAWVGALAILLLFLKLLPHKP